MSWAAMVVGGAAASAGGGFLNAQRQGRAARQSRDSQQELNAIQMLRQNQDLYGDEEGLRRTLEVLPPAFRETLLRDRFGIATPPGETTVSGAMGLVRGGGASGGAGGGILAGFEGLEGFAAGEQRGIGQMYRRQTGNLFGLARGAEGIARQYGRGGEELIDEQSGLDLRKAQRAAGARLNATGFGNSTFASGVPASLAEQFSRGARQQKLGLRQATTDRLLGARSQTLGLMGGRFAGATAMAEGNLNRTLGLRQMPLQTRLGLSTRQGFIPSYTPAGASPGGTALGNFGNAMAMGGAFGLAGGGGGGGASPQSLTAMSGGGGGGRQLTPQQMAMLRQLLGIGG